MNFDFKEIYKGYSNTELLKITGAPESYQPEAVAAANAILATRDVTDAERKAADRHLAGIDDSPQEEPEKTVADEDRKYDLLEPILNPAVNVDHLKWHKLFLSATGIIYVVMIVYNIAGIFNAVSGYEIYWSTVVLKFLTIIYAGLIMLLVYRQQRWGWILLLADRVVTVAGALSTIWLLFTYPDLYKASSTFLWLLPLSVAFIVFLLRNETCRFFKVNEATKKNALIISIAIAAMLYLGNYAIGYFSSKI